MREIVSGRKPVLEALRSNAGLKSCISKRRTWDPFTPCLPWLKKSASRYSTDQRRLDELAEGGLHQGGGFAGHGCIQGCWPICCALPKNGTKRPFADPGRHTGPAQLRAMLRTAEVCGCHGVIVPRRNMAPMTQVVHKGKRRRLITSRLRR